MGTFDQLQLGAFKDLIVSKLRPIIQLKFPYNINTDQITTTLTGFGEYTY